MTNHTHTENEHNWPEMFAAKRKSIGSTGKSIESGFYFHNILIQNGPNSIKRFAEYIFKCVAQQRVDPVSILVFLWQLCNKQINLATSRRKAKRDEQPKNHPNFVCLIFVFIHFCLIDTSHSMEFIQNHELQKFKNPKTIRFKTNEEKR